jgi:Cft2 family RNA processing exonuclease
VNSNRTPTRSPCSPVPRGLSAGPRTDRCPPTPSRSRLPGLATSRFILIEHLDSPGLAPFDSFQTLAIHPGHPTVSSSQTLPRSISLILQTGTKRRASPDARLTQTTTRTSFATGRTERHQPTPALNAPLNPRCDNGWTFERRELFNARSGGETTPRVEETVAGEEDRAVRITNLNPADEIGASGWLVEVDGHRLLLDAGVHPKRDGRDALPLFEAARTDELDAIAISHAHHDHVGALPVAARRWPSAHVLMTDLTYFLVERVLHNSVNVMLRQREELGVRDYPLYNHTELDELAPRFQGFRYNREIEWAAHSKLRAGISSPTLEFYDAGHTLGSAGVMVRSQHETLFYTGDVSFRDQTLLKGARFEDVEADVLIMETTRGSRATPSDFTRTAETERLLAAIQAALKRRACVLIPTFALGRTQEVLALLALWMRSGRLRRQTIHIGGLGRVFTEIYDLQAHRTHRHHSQLLLHESLDLTVLDPQQLARMKLTGPRLFVLTAGMLSENTAAHDLATRIAAEPHHAIFFVGYADPSTPGGRLKCAPPGQPFFFSTSAGELTRNCDLQDFDLTAHATREELLEFVDEVAPRVVVLGHGDPAARAWFQEQISLRHPKTRVLQPQPGETLEIQ